MNNSLAQSVGFGPISGVGRFQDITNPLTQAENFISLIVGVITAIAGIAFLIYFVTGALTWITSGGDKSKTEQAQKTMSNAAIGLVAVIVAYFIAGIVGTVLDIPILNPSQIFQNSTSQ